MLLFQVRLYTLDRPAAMALADGVAVLLPLSLAFAAASWLLVERPALALERRASRSRRLRPLLSPTG